MAVADELKKLDPEISVVFIGARGSVLMDIPENDPNIDQCFSVNAGKFRRYHGEGVNQLLDFHTQYLNLRDFFRTMSGVWQSYLLLSKIKPAAVFTRGGFVSVPVGVASWLRRIPFVTHDSDSTPSLANRIIAPLAKLHLVALDPAGYPYPHKKTLRVGVPISSSYRPVDAKTKAVFKSALGLAKYKQIICATGGGNGAETLNRFILDNAAFLLKKYPHLALIHFAGRTLAEKVSKEYDDLLPKEDRKRVVVKDFVNDFYRYSGAADLIIARGGATNLAEFAAQAKPCIIIPSKQLVWNIKNARELAREGAIVEMSEEQAEQELRLSSVVTGLLDDVNARNKLAKKFAQFYVPDATAKIAETILKIARKDDPVNK